MTNKERFVNDVMGVIGFVNESVRNHSQITRLDKIESCVKTLTMDCKYCTKITKNSVKPTLCVIRCLRDIFKKENLIDCATALNIMSNVFEDNYL
jgi:hypothetical protein